jgi:hypothetical protein
VQVEVLVWAQLWRSHCRNCDRSFHSSICILVWGKAPGGEEYCAMHCCFYCYLNLNSPFEGSDCIMERRDAELGF